MNEPATDPAKLGRWEPLQDWPVIGVFVSLLPDGRVLTFDSVGDEPAISLDVHTFTRAAIWAPLTDTWTLGRRMDYPRWYPAVTPLTDGDMLISGGCFAVSEVREVDGAISQLSTAASNVWNNAIYR